MRWIEYTVFLALVIGLARPMGIYLARVFGREPTFLDPVLDPIERLLYRLMRVRRHREMSASIYCACRKFRTT